MPAARSPLTVVYPYYDGGRERLAAGFVLELDTTQAADNVVDAILTHPASASLLYVAHDHSRIVALVGDVDANREMANAVAHQGKSSCAFGRVRADVAGRPVGELVDQLVARQSSHVSS